MKHIVVSGCSFTNNYRCNLQDERYWLNDRIEDWTWAHWLQQSLKETHILHNYGTITNDNKTIIRSIIYKISDLLKEGVNPNDINVIAQFTSLTRNSFFITLGLLAPKVPPLILPRFVFFIAFSHNLLYF